MKALTIVGAVQDALRTEMLLDPSVVVFGEDVGQEGGVFRATVELQKEFGVERCFDSPLAESGIVGTAVGMAIAGLKPVVEMQFCGFVWPAMNQIICHVARYRNRTRGAMPLPMVIRFPYGGGIRALEHHSESYEATFAHIPGLKVVIPSTPYDTKGLLISAIRSEDPIIFMEPKRLYRSFKQEVPDEAYTIEIGKAAIRQEGKDITLISYGAQMKEATQAAAELKKEGISVELIDLRTIHPFDEERVLESVKKTGRVLVVHEGHKAFGIGAEIVSLINEELYSDLLAPPSRLAAPNIIFPLPKSEQYFMIETEQIKKKIKELVQFQP